MGRGRDACWLVGRSNRVLDVLGTGGGADDLADLNGPGRSERGTLARAGHGATPSEAVRAAGSDSGSGSSPPSSDLHEVVRRRDETSRGFVGAGAARRPLTG